MYLSKLSTYSALQEALMECHPESCQLCFCLDEKHLLIDLFLSFLNPYFEPLQAKSALLPTVQRSKGGFGIGRLESCIGILYFTFLQS